MHLCKGIFGEPEIIEMTPVFWYALEGVLDDKIALRVQEFWEQENQLDDSPLSDLLRERVKESKECIGDSILRHTFHIEVHKRGILSKVSNIFMTNILYTLEDRDELERDLEWLVNNKAYWKPFIDVRENAKYKAFVEQVQVIYNVVSARSYLGEWSKLGLTPNRNLMSVLQDNKEAFYKLNEKRRSTRMDLIFKKSTELEYMLHGLKFEKEFTKEDNSGFFFRRAF